MTLQSNATAMLLFRDAFECFNFIGMASAALDANSILRLELHGDVDILHHRPSFYLIQRLPMFPIHLM